MYTRATTFIFREACIVHQWKTPLMGLSPLYNMMALLHIFLFYGQIAEASHMTTASQKSPSFVCLTSGVRALCLASCFEVCPQKHRQSSFCCPSGISV